MTTGGLSPVEPATTATRSSKHGASTKQEPRQNSSPLKSTSTAPPVAPSLTPPTPSLTTLPSELIMKIACHLDNRSFLQLAIAWRPFLHAHAQGLDPWNPVRRRLKAACAECDADESIDWQEFVELRYNDWWSAVDRDDRECEVQELLIHDVVGKDVESIFPALYDFLLLDGYRRRYEKSLFSGPIALELPIAAHVATIIYAGRFARGLANSDPQPPPFTICASFQEGEEIEPLHSLRELVAMAMALCFPITLITQLRLSVSSPEIDLVMPHLCRMLGGGTSRLQHIALQDGQPPIALIDAITKGCRHLKVFEVIVEDHEGASAVARAVSGMPSMTNLNLDGGNFADCTLVQTIADAVAASTTLTNLAMTDCDLNSDGAERVFHALHHNSSVHTLDLTFNRGLGDGGASALANFIRHSSHTTLNRIDVKVTGITDTGAVTLAEAFAVHLDVKYVVGLESNRIGARGRKAFSELKNVHGHVGKFRLDYEEGEEEEEEEEDDDGGDDDDDDDDYDSEAAEEDDNE